MISNVPAAPWDPTTLAARARAAQAIPAGTVVVEGLVVEELVIDELGAPPDGPVESEGDGLDGDEHADSPKTATAAPSTALQRKRCDTHNCCNRRCPGERRALPDRRLRRNLEGLRS